MFFSCSDLNSLAFHRHNVASVDLTRARGLRAAKPGTFRPGVQQTSGADVLAPGHSTASKIVGEARRILIATRLALRSPETRRAIFP